MRRPSIVPNTTLALQATEYAQQQGLFDPFHRAMYRAYWEDGKNLGDLEVIREVAEECGLNWTELEQRLESGFYQETVIGQYQEALSLDIRGIPAFLIGNILFTGARPYEVFKAVAEKALGQRDGG
jgi:predicted DsbA family dithiol-disulfide isomerase